MAVLDTTSNEIVIRVVYDGPPEAGKTTSMRALASSFSQSTVTPEENSKGRTQWFDWMEYVGGRFEGSQIRCQVVSVPGQRELDRRRRALLATADVIVFVGDSSRARWDVTLEYLFELHGLRNSQDAPIGIILQANKRDVPGAVSLGEMRERLGDARWEVGLVESIAAEGTGIREAFVYAVRLALDRVRELINSGRLPEGRPEHTSPAELLAQLRAADAAATAHEQGLSQDVPSPPASTIEASLLDEVAARSSRDDAASMRGDAWNAAAIDASLDTIVYDMPPAEPIIESNRHSVAATLLQEILAGELAAAAMTPLPLPPVVADDLDPAEFGAEPYPILDEVVIASSERPTVELERPSTAVVGPAEATDSGAQPAALADPGSGPVSLPRIPAPPKQKLALGASPRPPDATVPSGAIWPPVEGRTILMEVSQTDLVARRHGNGDWSAGLGSGWRLVSKRDALYDSLDMGRNALVQWARLHAACMSVVSPHRCIVLASTGDGRWRLWQIVRAEESLRDRVERASSESEPAEVIDRLCETAQLLVDVNERIAESPCDLPVNLDTIGACDESGKYIGLMPESLIGRNLPRVAAFALLLNELGPVLALDLADRRPDLGRALQNKPKADIHADVVFASLQQMLGGATND